MYSSKSCFLWPILTVCFLLTFPCTILAVTLSIPNTACPAGQPCTVAVAVDNPAGIVACEMNLTFNHPEIASIDSISTTTISSSFSLASNISASEVKIAMATGVPIQSGSGGFVNVRFEVSEEAQIGTVVTVALSNVALYDGSGNLIPASVSGGSITVVNPDSDDDGLLDSWEMHYFGNLNQGPDDDYDQDGLTNLEEYQEGTDPTVPDDFKLIKPEENDVLESGSSYTIRWIAHPQASKYNILWSADKGEKWEVVARNITGTSFPWHVPIPTANKKGCLIKVIGFGLNGVRIGGDQSDAPFTIEVVKLAAPDGREVWESGSQHTISWDTHGTKRDVAKVKLYYTKDGGKKWLLIKNLNGNPGEYVWTLPMFEGGNRGCKMKVVLLDKNGNSLGSDASDGYFTIEP